MKERNKVVVKLGTSSLTQGSQKLSQRLMLGFVQQIIELQNSGKQVILVSSGAVAAGRELLDAAQDSSSKQMYASVGQARLMQVWSELFSLFDYQVGQVLLTKEDFTDSSRSQNARETLQSLLKHKVIPIINENDMVTAGSKESRVGDNDNLASFVACLIQADALVLLTDQEGLYTADPRFDSEAKLISFVKQMDASILSYASGSASSQGTGGMATKIQAAERAAKSGICTIIASSLRPHVLIDICNGKLVGTLFQEEKMLKQ